MNKPPSMDDVDLADPADGRSPGDWRSRYSDVEARKGIRIDAIYLATLLFATPLLLLVLWLEYPKRWLGLSDLRYAPIMKYGLAWLGGVLGGTLFDVKWFYRSVARQLWHLDRRLWRLFAPHISGGLAFAVIALVSSGMLRIFNSQALESRSIVVAIAFMVGYFSDSAVAKLAEVADTLFGVSRAKERHAESGSDEVSKEPSTPITEKSVEIEDLSRHRRS